MDSSPTLRQPVLPEGDKTASNHGQSCLKEACLKQSVFLVEHSWNTEGQVVRASMHHKLVQWSALLF